jgi:hypothetical protein
LLALPYVLSPVQSSMPVVAMLEDITRHGVITTYAPASIYAEQGWKRGHFVNALSIKTAPGLSLSRGEDSTTCRLALTALLQYCDDPAMVLSAAVMIAELEAADIPPALLCSPTSNRFLAALCRAAAYVACTSPDVPPGAREFVASTLVGFDEILGLDTLDDDDWSTYAVQQLAAPPPHCNSSSPSCPRSRGTSKACPIAITMNG